MLELDRRPHLLEEEPRNRDRMCGWTITIIDAREVSDVGTVLKVQILPIPARLKVQLSSKAIDTIRLINVMGLWNVISFIYAAETYPISYRPNVLVCQRCGIVVP